MLFSNPRISILASWGHCSGTGRPRGSEDLESSFLRSKTQTLFGLRSYFVLFGILWYPNLTSDWFYLPRWTVAASHWHSMDTELTDMALLWLQYIVPLNFNFTTTLAQTVNCMTTLQVRFVQTSAVNRKGPNATSVTHLLLFCVFRPSQRFECLYWLLHWGAVSHRSHQKNPRKTKA